MEKIEKYQKLLIALLEKHAAVLPAYIRDAENQVIADIERNHFQLVTIGWDGQRFVHSVAFHFDIKPNGKIWLQANWTDTDVAAELEELGVPKSDIVLGFQPVYARPYSGYASA